MRIVLAELLVQVRERLHLPIALGGAAALGRMQIADRRLAGLERRRGHARAEVAAGQLHRRRRPADVHERRQVLVGAAQRVGDPTAEGRMIELPAAMPGAGLDHRREMVRLVAPHRADHGDLVDHAADVREPVGDRDAGLAVPGERAQAGDHRPLASRARLSPKPMASISLPAHLLSFGSKVSIWLTPPHMNRKMTDFALGGKCGPSGALGHLAVGRQTPPIATPRKPPPAWWRKPRRETRPQG